MPRLPAVPSLPTALCAQALLLAFLLTSGPAMAAPIIIDSVTTSTVSGTSTVRVVGGEEPATVTYNGEQQPLTSFDAGGDTYTSVRQGQAYVRRNTAPQTFPEPNPAQVLTYNYRLIDGPPPTIYGEYHNTFEAQLTKNDFRTGSENTFFNDGATGLNVNLERIDFIFDTPINITADHAFAVFERGGGGGGANVGLKLAAITSLDGFNLPDDYSNPFHIPDSAYDTAPGVNTASGYDVYRYLVDGGPELDYRSINSNLQHIVGVAVPALDVVSLGTPIYGYSLMGQDVTATMGSQLVDWENATFFPTGTQAAGDVDMPAIGAQLWTSAPVPEPSSAALLVGAAFAALARRSRSHRRHRAARITGPRLRNTLRPFLAAALLLAVSAPALRAALVLDESSHTVTSSIGSIPGFLTGFEFTTPTGSSFELGEIKASFFASNGYSGSTDFTLYTRSGADLTAISAPVGITGIPTVTPATFDFATHAITVDFSSQSILLDPNMQYTILAEHNGGAGNVGIIFRFEVGPGPIPGAGRVSASVSLDDANFEDHNDVVFQIYDTVPEPSSALLLCAAGAILLGRRRRTVIT